MSKRILFLCTGNYYRSRFAEEMFNHLAPRAGLDWVADSCALALERGSMNVGPISAHSRDALRSRNVKLAEPVRAPRALTAEHLASADRVIALKEAEHRPMVMARFPDWSDRVEYWHVHDLDQATAAEALREIEEHVIALIDSMASKSERVM